MSVVDRTSSEFKAYLELYSAPPARARAGWPTPSAGGSIPSRSSRTSSTATSTTRTSASPTAGSARSTAGPSTARATCCRFEQIGAKIDESKAIGGVQILLQGGHNPYIPFEWYLDLMRYIKRNHPIHIHGF